jgi:hypothetical protein
LCHRETEGTWNRAPEFSIRRIDGETAMDILVPEGGCRRTAVPAREARTWGLVAVAVVAGLIVLLGVVERGDRLQMASNDPVTVQRVPALLIPEPLLP